MNAVLRSERVVFSSKLTYGQQFICKNRAPSLSGLLMPRGGRHTVVAIVVMMRGTEFIVCVSSGRGH